MDQKGCGKMSATDARRKRMGKEHRRSVKRTGTEQKQGKT